LETILDDNPVEIRADAAFSPSDAVEIEEKASELGIWLSGLRSYLAVGLSMLLRPEEAAGQQYTATEFNIVHSGLTRCILLNSYILSRKGSFSDADILETTDLSVVDLSELSNVLNEAVLISESLTNSPVLGPGQWRAWSDLLNRRFDETNAYFTLVNYAESTGSRFLPTRLAELGADPRSVTAEHAELILVLPRFGIVLKWLSVIRKMLDADKPLKASLLIFSRVNELVMDLTNYINSRLDRFPNQEAELFSTLDAASYTASIELKKVYTQELAGVASMRPTPSIYARIETAYSLLNDGFQQILAGFLLAVDPTTEIIDVFPEFQVKLKQSIALRSELWKVAQVVKAAEKTPDSVMIDNMKLSLNEFRQGSLRFLFYKDTETVERFIEEIIVTNNTKDLVPLLHRFGAFLETLFGQVALRAVFEKHPFEPPQDMYASG
jgi:hypothetical protein